MKTLTILILFINFTFSCLAQAYQSFPISKAVWREKSGGYQSSNCADYQFTIIGDTLINSLIYHKIQKTGVQYKEDEKGLCTNDFMRNIDEYAGCFREDIPKKKIFIIKPSSESETLIYDFNLSVGDSLPNVTGYFITSIDSVQVGGIYHKRVFYKDCVARNPSIIEGIGSTYGLFTPWMCPFESSIDLLCFKLNNQTVYPTNSTNCSLVAWSVKKILVLSLNFYPNPANSKIYIDLSNQTLNYDRLEIINNNGQKCISQSVNVVNGPIEVNIEKLNKGLYLVKLINDQGHIYTKMIKT